MIDAEQGLPKVALTKKDFNELCEIFDNINPCEWCPTMEDAINKIEPFYLKAAEEANNATTDKQLEAARARQKSVWTFIAWVVETSENIDPAVKEELDRFIKKNYIPVEGGARNWVRN